MTYPSVSRWLADRRVRTAPRTLPLGTRRALGFGAGALTLLTLAASMLPLSAAAATDWSANCSARLRTQPNTGAVIKKSVPKGTVVTASESVAGGSYSATCGSSVAGTTWLKIVAVNNKSVSSLYGVSVVYSAKGLYKSMAAPTAPPITAPPVTAPPVTAPPATNPPATNPPPPPTNPPPTNPPPTNPPPTGNYTFSDEFNGTSLDTTKWRASNYGVTGGGRRCCGTNMANYANEVSVSGGYLRLGATKVGTLWHTGTIDTETKKLFQYGKWEASIKFPRGMGLWPAFWGYANSGEEIDVLENCSGPAGSRNGNDVTLAHQGIHRGNSTPRVIRDSRHGDLSTAFHTYGVEWRSGFIQFYFDGQPMGTQITPSLSDPMPLILNLGVGGDWCGDPDSTTPTAAEMLVDWVHVSP